MATSSKGILKPTIILKDEVEQNPQDPMVILVHVLRRYLSEVVKKPKYVVDDFFQKVRSEVNQSIKKTKGDNELATFSKFVELLHGKHKGLLKGITSSKFMRGNELLAIKRIYQFGGSNEEIQQLLKILNGVKKDEVFRKRIDHLVNLTDLMQPVSAITSPKFGSYLLSLYRKKLDFKRLILHIFEKAASSQRMAKLSTTVLLALNQEKTASILKEIFPDLLRVEGQSQAFVNVYTHLFLARDNSETEIEYIRRVSKIFRQELKQDIFQKEFSRLPQNKLLPANHPLASILKSLIARSGDFLHLLTQQIFIDSPGDILPRIPLDVVRRGLIAIYNYSGKQADDYLNKFTTSITFYYQNYLPPDKKDKSHFYLMISALSKYVADLLQAVYEKKIFRDSEIETWMPLLKAIRLFHEAEDKDNKAIEIWNILMPIRQKKEIRDQLTLMNNLTDGSSGTYLKDFIPFITRLTIDKEQFKLIFNHIFEQTRLDKQKFESTIRWHANLLNNMIRYLSDISITSDPDTLPILNNLVLGMLYISKTHLQELIGLLSKNNLATIRDLIDYLYSQFPGTLIQVIKSLIRLNDDDFKDEAAAFIQYIHTTLLEQARQPGISPTETQREIDNIKQLFDECCKDIGELYQHWEKYIFSDAYKMSISNLLKIEIQPDDKISDNGVINSNLPPLIVSLITQAAKIFNVPNFAGRTITNFTEILEWAIDEMQSASGRSVSILPNICKLHDLFAENYRFPQVSSNSIFHNFANKSEFDYFSFCFLAYAVGKRLEWGDMLFRNSWRDVTITVNTGAEDLELKKNVIVNSTAMINSKSMYFKELDRLLAPLKAETAIETFFHLKNGIALADTRRYRLAAISLDKALNLHKTNIYAHYWRAMTLKKAKASLEQYEKHITIIEKYYPNSNEVKNLKKTPF
ncbi:MAG: hypothetical protein HN580_12755 [Deltaproteobacteria bacterium]|jgi:hypothetical protein|nr:hypothetical protein [Deltaproteobacteria bacterium]MBT4264739.1 hypothetical protein [Deltaproteobacteria bacterium]MBT4640446.1 hypothetical protein [Deltaproteobacteria bacterium]MBT6502905.1 hypothetical protein [Deltaproteobacteria bacterium]MBT6611727.1 hypothetical protein [Deltaproteobacteria bacterium]